MNGNRLIQILGALVIVAALTALYLIKGGASETSPAPASYQSDEDRSLKGLTIN